MTMAARARTVWRHCGRLRAPENTAARAAVSQSRAPRSSTTASRSHGHRDRPGERRSEAHTVLGLVAAHWRVVDCHTQLGDRGASDATHPRARA